LGDIGDGDQLGGGGKVIKGVVRAIAVGRQPGKNPQSSGRSVTSLLRGFIAELLLIVPVQAESPASVEKKDFATAKQYRLAKIDTTRACVAKSSSFEEMKACKPERKKKQPN